MAYPTSGHEEAGLACVLIGYMRGRDEPMPYYLACSGKMGPS